MKSGCELHITFQIKWLKWGKPLKAVHFRTSTWSLMLEKSVQLFPYLKILWNSQRELREKSNSIRFNFMSKSFCCIESCPNAISREWNFHIERDMETTRLLYLFHYDKLNLMLQLRFVAYDRKMPNAISIQPSYRKRYGNNSFAPALTVKLRT